MYQYGTLIFTGRHTGKGDRELQKVDGGYFYLGRLNRDRTVVATVLELCRQHSNCTAHEVYEAIKFYTQRLIESGKFPKEFPNKDEEYEYMSLEDVKRHLNSVVYRSEQNASKYIPHGIERVPNTVYFMFTGGMKTVVK